MSYQGHTEDKDSESMLKAYPIIIILFLRCVYKKLHLKWKLMHFKFEIENLAIKIQIKNN